MNLDALRTWFSDPETSGWFNIDLPLYPGHLNQSASFTLDDPIVTERPPCLILNLHDREGKPEHHSRTMVHLEPADCRQLAAVLTAFAEAWEPHYEAFMRGAYRAKKADK